MQLLYSLFVVQDRQWTYNNQLVRWWEYDNESLLRRL